MGIRKAVAKVFPSADIWLCEWHLREKLRLRLVRARANAGSDRVWQRLQASTHSEQGWEMFCVAAYRHRPVLTEVCAWIDRWDDTVRDQLDRRPTKRDRDGGMVVSSAGVDRRLNQVRAWLNPRRNAFGNRDRLDRLLMLMQLQLNDVADETRYASHIRDWLDVRHGHASTRRVIVDAADFPSLRGSDPVPGKPPPEPPTRRSTMTHRQRQAANPAPPMANATPSPVPTSRPSSAAPTPRSTE